RSNLEDHYGDPEFKRSVEELLSSTIERLDGIVHRWSAEEEHVLIKVAVDLNGILRDVAGGATRRGARLSSPERAQLPLLSLALPRLPDRWAAPYFLRAALSSLVDSAIEGGGEGGKVLTPTFSPRRGRRGSPAVVEITDNGSGMSADFVRDRLFRPFQ